MKLLYKQGMFIMLLCLTTVASFAQLSETRPKLFADKAQTISLDNATLENAIAQTQGNLITVNLAANFQFTGNVIFNERRNNQLQTMAIRSSENSKSVLQISKITNKDNTISYAGRIINPDAADGFLIKNNNGIITLQKFEALDVLSTCM